MKRSELFFTFILIPIDILMVFLAFILAYKFRIYFEIVPAVYFQPLVDYMKFFIILIPFWILIFALTGLYSASERKTALGEFGKIFVGVSASIALVMAWIFLSRIFFFSRLIIAFTWGIAIITVTFGRYFIRFLQQFCYRWNIGMHQVIVLGSNGSAKTIAHEIKNNRKLGYRLIKIVGTEGINKLDTIIKNNPCDEIILADNNLGEKEVSKVLEFCRLHNLSFKLLPNLFLVRSSHVDVLQLAGVPVMDFKRTSLDGWGKIIKRIFDLIVSLILILVLSPLMLLVTLMVKITSKGPILFRQERVGLERNFTFYKFRTMRENAEKQHQQYIKQYGNMFKLKNDPRLTIIGKFLRKTSLDELPQFFNVLRGEMSLIGPRPPMPEEVEKYSNWQKRRLGVKPGITGLWQVSGRSELSFDEWVKLDAYYIENWSLWLDFQIFLRTIWVVIKGIGAY